VLVLLLQPVNPFTHLNLIILMDAKKVLVVGVGMTKFYKPGTHDNDYHDLAALAMKRALKDANLLYEKHIEQVYAGHVYGDSTCGQRAVYQMGKTGIPIFNVNNNSCTGATAIYMARQAIAFGTCECVMVVGFEKMHAGPHRFIFKDRAMPTDNFEKHDQELVKNNKKVPLFVKMWAHAG
jgi:acetyl-CoA acetyltransferase